ncbi:MAG: NnrS family protein [Sulfurimonas sp.]
MREQQSKENYFMSQPHQPFFILGVANAILMMLLFALSYKSLVSMQMDALTFHVYSLTYLVFTNVFTGFLFTTFSKFNQAQLIAKKYYTRLFFSQVIGTILFLVGVFTSLYLITFAMTLLFVSQLFIVLKLQEIYREGSAPDKSDSFWILTANYFGLIANLLFIFSLFIPSILSTAINISFYLYIIFLAFSVGQRMIPFFSHSFVIKNENFVKIIAVLFLLKTIFSILDIKIVEIIIDLLLATYLAYEFLRWKLNPLQSPAILWVLHLALFWLPTAFLLSAISLSAELLLDTSFYFLNIHLLSIGFLTTLLIGFGTRVTLGHAGQAPQADKFAAAIFIFIQVVVLTRVLFSLNVAFAWNLNFLFDVSITGWTVLFLVWSFRYAKVLVLGSKR